MASLQDVGAQVEPYPDKRLRHYQLMSGQVALGGVCRAIVLVRSHLGIPLAGVEVTDEWPDGHFTKFTDAAGYVDFFFGPESKFWPPNMGPHKIYVGRVKQPQSDVVQGVGLPEGQHADYQLVFQLSLGQEADWDDVEIRGKLWGVVPVHLAGKIRIG